MEKEMKIGSSKTLMAWCKQAPHVRERIVWDKLPDAQKDAAVVAYLIDLGTPYAITIANRLNLPSCADNVKESAMRNTEYEIQYMVRQYNDSLDLRDAELSGERDIGYCKKSFASIFGMDKKMYDAGHRPEDFC
jgi:hypothetical protein